MTASAAIERELGAPRRCGRGCRRPWSGSGSRCRPARAARRSTTSWCRRSGRAAARCRRRRPRSSSALPQRRAIVGAAPGCPATRYCTPVTTRQDDGDPQRARRRATAGRRSDGRHHGEPTASSCTTRLDLGQRRAGTARPRRPQYERYRLIADLPHRDERAPGTTRTRPTATSATSRAEHEDLVGERVEERAGPGRAVAPGQAAVDAVGDAEHDPDAEREPRRGPSPTIITNSTGETSRRSDRDRVGRRRRAPTGPNGLAGRLGRSGHRAALRRSGPAAPTISTVAERAGRRGPSGTSTIPSISGASRWVRPTPGVVDQHLDRRRRSARHVARR